MENTMTAPEQGTEQINQGAIVDDFEEQFVDQEAPIDTPNPDNGQTNQSTVNTENKEQPPQKPVKPSASAKPAPVDALLNPFKGEDGNFSADKWNGFFQNHKPAKVAPINLKVEAPKPGEQQQVDNREPWERAYEEQEKHKESIQKNLFAWRSYYQSAIQQGATHEQAMAHADNEVNTWLNGYIGKYSAKLQYQMQQESLKGRQEEVELARLQPQADLNYSIVAQEFGGAEQLKTLLTHPELAGDHMLWLFSRDNPGKSFATAQERDKAIDNWFIRKMGQNPDDIRRIARIGMAMYRDKYFDKVIEHVKKGASNAPVSRKQVASAQTRTVQRNNAPAKPDALSNWFAQPGQRGEEEFVSQEA